jgi:CheY-like chemotaxis protein
MSSETTAATGPRVLVVDDNADHRFLLTTHLTRAGCTVTEATTAEEAMVAYRHAVPDIAMVDLLLPGITGWDLVRWLRTCRQRCAVVTMSVLDLADHPAAEATLQKPFTRAQLLQALDVCTPG